jgi:hypothetical protein
MSFFCLVRVRRALGVVDDGFAVLAPVEKVVRRAARQQAEAFEVVGLDVAELIIEPRMHRLRHQRFCTDTYETA